MLSSIFLSLVVCAASTAAQELCLISTTPVTACGPGDLTTANWNKFNVDNDLFGFINGFGTSDNFPRFFVQQNTPTTSPFDNFDCSSFSSTNCQVPKQNNPHISNCVFKGLENTFCANFVDPADGFVVQNYINLWQGLKNHYDAVKDAGDAITNANFIDTMVKALAPKKQSIAVGVFNLIADLVTDIIPIGGEIKAAATFMKKIRLVIKETKSDLKDDSNDIVSIVKQNEAIDKEISADTAQLKQQLNNMVTGTQSRLQRILDQVFGKNKDPQLIEKASDVGNTMAFLNAYHGVFLDDMPSRSDLAKQMQTQLQNWIVSSVLEAMSYDVTIDTTALADVPSNPGGVCKAENGFTVSGGCALFRINGIDSKGAVIDGKNQGNDIFALQNVAGIDVQQMVANAQACDGGKGGGKTDFEGFLAMENSNKLPDCMFNFRVVSKKL
ncbi:hypothetical protein BGZ60DRAFT_426868 [Tricladium varicosporioides]|nr:hypothetical protein BGZ60DRAFT_426868 [Hymenoscyphus varicosporioides]